MRASDAKLARLAHAQAIKSKMRQKIGVVITSGKTVISRGFNRWVGFPIGKDPTLRYRWSQHAEIKAIQAVLNEKTEKSLTLFSVRKNYGNAKPCPACMRVLASSSIGRVVYSNNGVLEEAFL
jgi:tRNA(Arg) A34 adenosine deaminase TadA